MARLTPIRQRPLTAVTRPGHPIVYGGRKFAALRPGETVFLGQLTIGQVGTQNWGFSLAEGSGKITGKTDVNDYPIVRFATQGTNSMRLVLDSEVATESLIDPMNFNGLGVAIPAVNFSARFGRTVGGQGARYTATGPSDLRSRLAALAGQTVPFLISFLHADPGIYGPELVADAACVDVNAAWFARAATITKASDNLGFDWTPNSAGARRTLSWPLVEPMDPTAVYQGIMNVDAPSDIGDFELRSGPSNQLNFPWKRFGPTFVSPANARERVFHGDLPDAHTWFGFCAVDVPDPPLAGTRIYSLSLRKIHSGMEAAVL